MPLHPRLLSLGTALAAVLILAGCASEGTPGAAPAATVAPSSDTSEVQHNDADTAFAQMMIVHHEGAIEMADLAVDRASTPDVRDLAVGISAAQQPEIDLMTAWLREWGEETSMSDMPGMDHSGMDMDGRDQGQAMGELRTLNGVDFDQRFLQLMIAHHQGAVQMAQTELADGRNPQALELAQKIVADQTSEIAEMEAMLQRL